MWLDEPPPRAARRADRASRTATTRASTARWRASPPSCARPEGAARRLRPEPRPGRQPRARRPAAAPRSGACAAAVVLFSPFTPLLFQGEEYGESAPFQFFTDHIDPFIADATREGRRREFARFAGFSGEVPDPQDAASVRALEARPPARAASELYRAAAAAAPRAAARARGRGRRGGADARAPPRPRDAPRRLRQRDGRARAREGLAGQAVPARPALGRRGHELLPLLRARREGRALPLRRATTARRATS